MRNVLILVISFMMFSPLACRADDSTVYIIHIKGEIDSTQAALVRRALSEANENKAQAAVIELDTFGGRVDAATEIRDLISSAPLHTICYIKNRAWSAGALIAIAHKHIAIAPGGSIGAAEPIPATEKSIAALKAEFAATANKTGRNPNIAEAMVDKTLGYPGFIQAGQILALTDYQAMKVGYADVIAPDIDEVLGFYGLRDAGTKEFNVSLADKLAAFLSGSIAKTFLLALVFLAVFTEVKTAGMGIAGLFGIMAAGLFFIGQYLAGTAGWLEIMLFVTGIMLLVMELFIPGFGLWGIIGFGCIMGSFFLALGGNAGAVSIMAISMILAIVVFLLILKRLPASRLYSKLILHETESLEAGFISGQSYERFIGKSGTALTLLRPSGIAQIDGEQLDVVSEGQYIEAGTKIKVIKTEGNRIIVKQVKE